MDADSRPWKITRQNKVDSAARTHAAVCRVAPCSLRPSGRLPAEQQLGRLTVSPRTLYVVKEHPSGQANDLESQEPQKLMLLLEHQYYPVTLLLQDLQLIGVSFNFS